MSESSFQKWERSQKQKPAEGIDEFKVTDKRGSGASKKVSRPKQQPTNQVVCPKCNGNKGYLGVPPARSGDWLQNPVPMCSKCDIQMYDPVLRKKTVEINRRNARLANFGNNFQDFFIGVCIFGIIAIIFFAYMEENL